MAGQDGVVHVGGREHVGEVVRQRLDLERCGAPSALAVPALVVEHDVGALLAEPARHGKPDLVAAPPAVGEHDDRRIGIVAWKVPHGQHCTVLRPHDLVLRPAHAFTPAEREAPVVGPGVGHPLRGETLVGRSRGAGRGQARTDEQQSP